MANKPLLIFPQAIAGTYTKASPNFGPLIFPLKDSQIRRLDSRLDDIETAFRNQSLRFSSTVNGLLPEMLLVFEIAGTIEDFFKAVEKTPGMDYLLEYQDEYMQAGSGFFYRDSEGELIERAVEKRVFVTLNNEQGIRELISYWNEFKYGGAFRRGVTKFRNLFNQLNDIRPYSLSDRLKDTGFEAYLADLRTYERETVKFEIEFTFHKTHATRELIIQELNQNLQLVEGKIIRSSVTVIPEIKYFGAIGEAPISSFEDLTDNSNVIFLQSSRILFFKPVGQIISKEVEKIGTDQIEAATEISEATFSTPMVALFDGVPIANHQRLLGKIQVDDPDDFSQDYLAGQRNHGTAMASLILNGNFDDPSVIKSKLYVRPILKLVQYGNQMYEERLPDNQLSIDVLHRAVRRLFEREEEHDAIAPDIKIINLSIGDGFRPFIRTVSSWARLIDYLSYKYKVLFIISAGNYLDNITINASMTEFEALDNVERQKKIYQALFERNFERKILTPAEAINGLTVGGFHLDSASYSGVPGRYDPDTSNSLPSAISRIGNGFNRSLKPDVIFDSGRVTYRVANASGSKIDLRLANSIVNYAPGIKVAIPGESGNTNRIGFSCGTSISTALVTNLGCKLYEVLDQMNEELPLDRVIPRSHYAVLIKALLVHYSDNQVLQDNLKEALMGLDRVDIKVLKEYILQNTGYGLVDKNKLGFCTDSRVTLIGFGSLKKEGGHIYKFPLPDALSGRKVEKKLTITLAWMSPINFNSGKYKMAQLFFDNVRANQNDLFLDRTGANFHISKRGTVQHDILSNDSADVYISDSELVVKVSCRESASGLSTRQIKHMVDYGIAVTLEVKEETRIPIYDEIEERIKQRLRVRS